MEQILFLMSASILVIVKKIKKFFPNLFLRSLLEFEKKKFKRAPKTPPKWVQLTKMVKPHRILGFQGCWFHSWGKFWILTFLECLNPSPQKNVLCYKKGPGLLGFDGYWIHLWSSFSLILKIRVSSMAVIHPIPLPPPLL